MRLFDSFFLIGMIFFGNLFATRWVDQTTPPRKLVILTIPKAGSHFLQNIVETLLDTKIGWRQARNITHLPFITIQHLLPSYEIDDFPKETLFIILIRDLRDVVLSKQKHIQHTKIWFKTPKQFLLSQYEGLDFNTQLSNIIRWPEESYNTVLFAREALKWMTIAEYNPHVLICRYEELVGPQGGGSTEAQHKALTQLANFLQINLSENMFNTIDAIYGTSRTFSVGQIGRWSSLFTEEHTLLFKQIMGQELIQLGYETNNNW